MRRRCCATTYLTDDEVRYVLGPEFGHVKAGHSKARIQIALRTGALRNVASATGGPAGVAYGR